MGFREGGIKGKERRTGESCTDEVDLGACVLTSYSEKENGFVTY